MIATVVLAFFFQAAQQAAQVASENLPPPEELADLPQKGLMELVMQASPLALTIDFILVAFSVFSWTIIFSRWKEMRAVTGANDRFLRAFRKSPGLEAVAMAAEQFRPAPVVTVFEFGYDEVARQARAKGTLVNKGAVERSLMLGINAEISRLEKNLNWLGTTASVCPFIGLFGTVWGIIGAFQGLATAGSASLRFVAPGISEALVATALGLGAAIPAAVAYNHFGAQLQHVGARLDDFALEFMNLVERTFEG
ncbi:MAG: MotA/TolQ/ExbB proton channel family protein [Bryobacterales bacterium]|nr:MotA/TolQ/ExbB proton channel family protein [Bryobacterales bacterium]